MNFEQILTKLYNSEDLTHKGNKEKSKIIDIQP
jgi:hypothetical protein